MQLAAGDLVEPIQALQLWWRSNPSAISTSTERSWLYPAAILIKNFSRSKLDGKAESSQDQNVDPITSNDLTVSNNNNNSNNSNNGNNGGLMELHNQAKELRLELEQKEAEIRELHLSKLSLQVPK